MKITQRVALGAAAAAAVGFAVPSLASPSTSTPSGGSGNHYPSSSDQSFTCEDSMGNPIGTVALTGPYTLWPPNHKPVDELATATSQNTSDNTTLTLMPQDVTDAIGGDGGPQHDPDIVFTGTTGPTASGTGTASVPFQLRAERSGKGDGRTYTLDWTAMFGTGSCSSSSSDTDDLLPFVVSVPHDMGNNG